MDDDFEVAVSVIVPVYNVERYLRRCLDSLASQTLGSAEFICLNDGSTDGSLEILREYAARDPRFVVIDKENSGYGSTMNEGLRRARGRYVGVIESDDWVEPDCFERLSSFGEQNGFCDIVKANHFAFDEAGERFVENYPEEVCGSMFEPQGERYDALLLSIPAIWAAIYRKGFLEDSRISFLETEGASYQDTGFVYKSWTAARSVLLVHDGFVHYRAQREGASSTSSGKVFQVCAEFDSIDEFVRRLPRCDERVPKLLAAKRFVTYRWNLKRLSWSDKRSFIMRAALDLREAERLAGSDKTILKGKRRKALRQWALDPYGYYLDLRVEAARKRNNASARLWRARRRLHSLSRKLANHKKRVSRDG